jgi:hypothetical protein
VAVYRTRNTNTNQLKESLIPTTPSGWVYYPNASPIWYGCNASGTGTIPLYGWANSSTGDFMFAKTGTSPLFGNGLGNNGYTVTNSGLPLLHIYTTKVSTAALPVYGLTGFQSDTNDEYHCTAINSNTLDGGWSEIVYNGPSTYDTDSATGLLGYALIS